MRDGGDRAAGRSQSSARCLISQGRSRAVDCTRCGKRHRRGCDVNSHTILLRSEVALRYTFTSAQPQCSTHKCQVDGAGAVGGGERRGEEARSLRKDGAAATELTAKPSL